MVNLCWFWVVLRPEKWQGFPARPATAFLSVPRLLSVISSWCLVVTEPRLSCLLQWNPNLWGRCWWKGKKFIQVLTTWDDRGFLYQSLSQHLSGGRGFYKAGEGKKNKEIKRRGVKSSLCADKQSILKRISEPVKWWSGMHHPGFMSSWFYIILALWLKVSTVFRCV